MANREPVTSFLDSIPLGESSIYIARQYLVSIEGKAAIPRFASTIGMLRTS
jgi:hypothetical protein